MGYISFRGEVPGAFREVLTLAPDGDLKTYATHLFGAMHYFEDADVEGIVAEAVPEEGIGIAVMDRLRKAAHDWQGPGGVPN